MFWGLSGNVAQFLDVSNKSQWQSNIRTRGWERVLTAVRKCRAICLQIFGSVRQQQSNIRSSDKKLQLQHIIINDSIHWKPSSRGSQLVADHCFGFSEVWEAWALPIFPKSLLLTGNGFFFKGMIKFGLIWNMPAVDINERFLFLTNALTASINSGEHMLCPEGAFFCKIKRYYLVNCNQNHLPYKSWTCEKLWCHSNWNLRWVLFMV